MTDLKEFRDRMKSYKSYRDKNPGKTYLDWKKAIQELKHIDIDNDPTYDYKGYYDLNNFAALDMLNKKSDAHFTDNFKTSLHPTFSEESGYSGYINKFNPNGITGGSWGDHSYNLSDSQMANDWDIKNTLDYLSIAENEGISLKYDDKYPVIDDTVIGGVLPEVEVKGYADGGLIPLLGNKTKLFTRLDLNTMHDLNINAGVYDLPTTEILHRVYTNGKINTVPTPGNGFVSNTDPIGKFIVESVALGKPLSLSNRYLNAAMTSYGGADAIENIVLGNYGKDINRDILTATELIPVTKIAAQGMNKIVNIGEQLKPLNIRNWIYYSKSPVSYSGIRNTLKNTTKGILSGKDADINNPLWILNGNKERLENYLKEDYFKNIDNKESGQHALEARTDAWRMRMKIPLKYNTFTPIEGIENTYTDKKGIEILKLNSNLGFTVPTYTDNYETSVSGNEIGDFVIPDFVNSSGGNINARITRFPINYHDVDEYGNINEYGNIKTFDILDYHPFERDKNRLINRSQQLYKKVFKTSKSPNFNFLKPLDKKLANLEAASFVGGSKPFVVLYNIPWNLPLYNVNNNLHELMFLGSTAKYGNSNYSGYLNKKQITISDLYKLALMKKDISFKDINKLDDIFIYKY